MENLIKFIYFDVFYNFLFGFVLIGKYLFFYFKFLKIKFFFGCLLVRMILLRNCWVFFI